ncbi:MAG: hypothetical protein MUE61_17715 [Vicinamibacterales bacterium]|jgi:hypothetical protein|nr:hypothetical protein [Vicinamibacterales bacterium]
MSAVLERRLREQRARVLVRTHDYRQRRHAHGVWLRLRRVLADASAAYVISADDARALAAEGHAVQPVGAELEPPKLIVSVPAERVRTMAGAEQVPVRLGGALLAAPCLALVPFDADSPQRGVQ